MRNPIFSVDTLFLDQGNDGVVHHTLGNVSKKLLYGERLICLETAQPLVEIVSESGKRLVMAPETAFALEKDETGALVRYAPVQESARVFENFVDWHIQPDMAALADDPRRWMIAGMVCGAGVHSFERHRASNFTIAAPLAYQALGWLQQVSEGEFRTKQTPRRLPLHTTSLLDGKLFVKGRAITSVVGALLEPKTQRITFSPMEIKRGHLWMFFYGLFQACQKGDEIVVHHRSADVIRTLADALWLVFGIPSTVSINPMEVETTIQRTNLSMPHHFKLSADQRAFAHLVGLDPSRPAPRPSFLIKDKIATLKPLDRKQASVIVMPGEGRRFPLTANSFVFRPQFSIPEALVDIAVRPEFVDSSDPTQF